MLDEVRKSTYLDRSRGQDPLLSSRQFLLFRNNVARQQTAPSVPPKVVISQVPVCSKEVGQFSAKPSLPV